MVNDPLVHPVRQPIRSIIVRWGWDDGDRVVEDIRWVVGNAGVTRIEAAMKNGEYAHIPYLRVWRGDVAVAEYCQHAVMEVLFEETPDAG